MIVYNWAGTGASQMQSHMLYDTARRLTYKDSNVFIKRDYFNYDANGMLQQNRYRGYGGTYIFNASGSLNFSRDTSGLITGITGDKELSAIYDPDLQISSINHTLPQPFAEGYTYDDNGNRLTSLTNSFIYDDLNRLTESTTHEYAYDADGNMTSERNKLTGETKKYYWDSENRLIRFEHLASDISPVDTTAFYKYDIFGRRLRKDVNGAITNFIWENDTMTYELDESYQPIRKYLTGMGIDNYEGHLEYSEITDWPHIFDANYKQPWYSYMKDQVGTIYMLYSLKTRSVVDNRTYDSFGNLVSQTGTTKTPLGFQGKYFDQESGLNYFYHRYYNPAIGRFTSEDPIQFEGGLNFNTFSSSNPINFIDPFGKQQRDTPVGTYDKLKIIYESVFGKSHQIFENVATKIELSECQICISKCVTEKLIELSKHKLIEKVFLSIVESIFPETWYLVSENILDITTSIHISIWAEECREKCKKVCCDKNK